ncbi:MAG: hypothetical protein ACRBBW_19045 [Cellvibrionaceae bacterium]
MKEDVVKIPTIKILLGITALNLVLVTGGTLFSTITVKSIQSNYEKSLASVRQSEREYQTAINLLENVSREADVINARISASIEALTLDVKQARDKQILMIEGEADYVVEAAVEARTHIRESGQAVAQLVFESKQKISEDYSDFSADVLVVRSHVDSLGEGVSQEGKNTLARMLMSQSKVKEQVDRSKLELQKLNQRTLEISQKMRTDMLQSVAALSDSQSQNTEIIDEGIAQFRLKLSQSEQELAAAVDELEDIRLAFQMGQKMMLEAPAAGPNSNDKQPPKKRPETN